MKISFLTLGLVLATACATVQAQPNPNLARGKKFVSSDPNTQKWHDGLTDGSWQPERGRTFSTGGSPTFPKTVTLDLKETRSLGYIALGTPPFGSTKTVAVSLSTDNTTFTEVARTEFAAGEEKKQLLNFPSTSARYVRLTYLDYHQKQTRYQPFYAFTTELEVYAPGTPPVIPTGPTPVEAADVPAPKVTNGVLSRRFIEIHESFLKRAKEGPIGLLFLGDSITDYWRRPNAEESWARFANYNPANFGIAGDRTQNVLWRIENGELDNIQPKVVVLLIGTNNTTTHANEEIVKGNAEILSEIHRRLPETKVLLLGLFPRGTRANNRMRAKVKAINAELAKLDDGQKTRFLDIGPKFLEIDGSISKEVMPDALHPGPKGYQIWADAISPVLAEMMK